MKYLAMVVIAVMIVGCNQSDGGNMAKGLGSGLTVVELPSGLVCVKLRDYNAGGLSCNWAKFNKEQGE
jgi:hypothetical protein